MSPFRVLVTGSRQWAAREAIFRALDDLLREHDTLTLVHGNAKGADQIAHSWALSANAAISYGPVIIEPHLPDWAANGKRAGFARNAEMVAAGADLCVQFALPCEMVSCRRQRPHDTHGTAHCAGLAETAGIPVRRITP